MSKNACGGCTACCTIMRVETDEWSKPARQRCTNCLKDGCAIYDARPDACRDWSCMWRYTQDEALRDLRMAPSLRPDRSRVVLEINEMGNIVAHCKYPNAWRREPMYGFLLGIAAKGRIAVILEYGEDRMPQILNRDGSLGDVVQVGVTNNSIYRRA